MSNNTLLKIDTHPDVENVFSNYPIHVKPKMIELRELVFETVKEINEITHIEETLKWGEPSYLVKHGSTLRMDWKSKTPNQYAMYFKCTSRLVETFKTVFKDKFQFEGKRAIIFPIDDKIPKEEVKICIKTTLMYHKVKQLPTLGI